jgi:hypothetical protein
MPNPDEIEHHVIEGTNAGEFDKPKPTSPRPKLTLVEGVRDQRKAAKTRADFSPAESIERMTPYAHAGAIARAMKAHPGLTYEEALKLAQDLGF